MRISAISNAGGRENNEDSMGRATYKDLFCFVLADGMGGHEGGEVASELAVNTVIDCFKSQPGMSTDLMYAYLEAAQNAIIEKRRESKRGARMGTTIVVLITNGKQAIWAHCGDSRIYRFKKHLIQEVSEDHSVAFASFLAGEIRYSEIRNSMDQNKLLRSLSDGETFNPNISNVVSIPPKTTFLLCTDGFWEYVTEDFMEKSHKKASTSRGWLKTMLEERKRNCPPDADNYSAIVVSI